MITILLSVLVLFSQASERVCLSLEGYYKGKCTIALKLDPKKSHSFDSSIKFNQWSSQDIIFEPSLEGHNCGAVSILWWSGSPPDFHVNKDNLFTISPQNRSQKIVTINGLTTLTSSAAWEDNFSVFKIYSASYSHNSKGKIIFENQMTYSFSKLDEAILLKYEDGLPYGQIFSCRFEP